MTVTVEMIIGALAKLEELDRVSDEYEQAWVDDPESEDAERNFDTAYRAQWEQQSVCAEMVSSFSKGLIDIKTAFRMCGGHFRKQLLKTLGI